MPIKNNNEQKYKRLVKEFNENIDKLFQKAQFTSMLILNEINARINYELESL